MIDPPSHAQCEIHPAALPLSPDLLVGGWRDGNQCRPTNARRRTPHFLHPLPTVALAQEMYVVANGRYWSETGELNFKASVAF